MYARDSALQIEIWIAPPLVLWYIGIVSVEYYMTADLALTQKSMWRRYVNLGVCVASWCSCEVLLF